MSDADTPPQQPDAAMLEDVLVALQKTFSRLSATTATRGSDEHRDKARALIVGDVAFEISLNVAPQPGHDSEGSALAAEHLRYCADGSGFPLKLSGRIATDVRHVAPPEAEP